MGVQCAGVVPLAATGSTIQAWFRWTLLVCALVISGIFSGAQEALAVTPGVQITSACSPNGPDSLTCDDLTPFSVRWTDTANPDRNGNQGTVGCYFVYSEGGNLLEAVGQPCTASTWPYYQSSTFPPFQVGVHHITVNRGFLGGDFPASSCCQTVEVVVTRAPRATYTTVTLGANPSSVHMALFSSKVIDFDQTKYPYSGTVTYKVDGQAYCTTGVASDGSAGDCLANPLSTGTHEITATFNGDPNHLGSSSFGVPQTIAPPPASIAATAGTPQQTPIGTGFAATLQVQVKDASGFPLPNQTVTFNGPASGPTAFLNTITPVTDNNGYAAVTATASGTPGVYVLTASVAGVAQTASFSLTNQLAPNIISFTKPSDTVFTATPPILAATASSTLAVTYTSGTVAVCKVTPVGMITFVSAGACSIIASQAGNTKYAVAADVTKTFAISQATQVISFNPPPTQTFAPAGSVALVATGGASGNVITFASTSTSVCTTGGSNGATATFVSAGTCAITASQAGTTNYSAAPNVPKSFAIGQAAQVISFTPPATQIYSPAGTVTLVATGGASGNPVTFASTSTGVCTTGGTNGATATFVSAGTCNITASQVGNTNYAVASSVLQSFIIGQASQIISFTPPATQTYMPNGTVGLSATGGASGLPVIFNSTSTSICTTGGSNGATVTFLTAGNCAMTASQAGNTNYSAAPVVPQSFNIGQATQTIAFTPPATQTFAPNGTVALVATGGASGNAVTFASTSPGVCTMGGTNSVTVTFVAAGSCTITASQAGNINYSAAPDVAKSFAINQAAQSISFTSTPPNPGHVKGPGYTAVATGGNSGNPVTFAIDPADAAVCSITGNKVILQAAGTCKINASQAGNTNYSAAAASQSFNVQDTIGPATKAIGGFISDRANLIVSNLFDMNRQIERLNQTRLAQGGADGSPNLVDDGKRDLSPMLQSSRLGSEPTEASITAAVLGTAGGRSSGQQDMMGFQSMLYDYLKAAGQGGNPEAFNFSGPMDMHANFGGGVDTASFKTSLSQMMNWEQQREQKEMSELGFGSGLSGSLFMPFDIWTDANYATYSGTRSGQFGMVTIGADYVFNPSILAGFYGQVDAMNQTIGTTLSGKGWMVGPYATARLSDTVFLQGRVGWGKSANGINTTGAVTDNFGSTRWLVSSSLSGRWKAANGLTFAPTASFTYFEDKSDSYVDSFDVTIPGVATTLGQLKLSPELSYGFATDSGLWIEPNIAPEMIWNFASTNVDGLGTLDGTATGPAGLRGRVKAGINLKTPSGIAISASGSYDGVGQARYQSLSANLNINVPLN